MQLAGYVRWRVYLALLLKQLCNGKVPAERLLEIEQVTGIARERLRPDSIGYRGGIEDATDEATVDTVERQKLAAHHPGQP